MCRERLQANSVFLGPTGSSFWALWLMSVSAVPESADALLPSGCGKEGHSWSSLRMRDRLRLGEQLETPSPGGLFHPVLSPVGAHCSFLQPFWSFCSLVLATDLSQPEKENWLLVSFLRNFSHSPFSPGFHVSLTRDCRSHHSHFLFFLKFVLIKEFCWSLTCYFRHQISHLLGGLRVPHLHLLGFPPKHRPEHRPGFLGLHPPHCRCSVTALQPFETWPGAMFLL